MTQQPMSRTLAQRFTMRCVDLLGSAQDLDASFEYDPADPFAVWIRFRSYGGDVRWGICRTLLSRGLTDPVGEGDVQLWPSIGEDGAGVVVFEFRSPDGHFVAQAPTRELYRFLTRTLAAVPFGSEAQYLDLDALVADLLGGSRPE